MQIRFMREALKQAEIAFDKNEVPVGAVIVKSGKIIARGYNLRESGQNAILHAEIVAINKACKKLKNFRLEECDIYVTLEPCPMCCGAIIMSRIKNVYFGAYDIKTGCAGSVYNLLADKHFNSNPAVTGGIMGQECGDILSKFFKNRRAADI